MAGAGFEQPSESTGKSTIGETGGAESGAVGAPITASDPDLARIVAAWPALDAATKEAILKMILAD